MRLHDMQPMLALILEPVKDTIRKVRVRLKLESNLLKTMVFMQKNLKTGVDYSAIPWSG